MADDPLGSVRLKVGRAEEHLAELQRRVHATAPSDVIRIVQEHDRETGWHSLRIEPIRDLPDDGSTVLADYATNLQTALNYLVRALVEANRRKPQHNHRFAVFPEPPEKGWVRNAFRGMHPDAYRLVKDLQPYLRPNRAQPEPLEIVAAFGNVERHVRPHGRVILFAPFDYREVTFVTDRDARWASPPRVSLSAGQPVSGAELVAFHFTPAETQVEMKVNSPLHVEVAFGDPPIPMPRIERLVGEVVAAIDSLSPFVVSPPPPA